MSRARLARSRLTLCIQTIIVLTCFVQVATAQSSRVTLDRLRQQRLSYIRNFHAALGRLAADCAEKSLPEGTTTIRRWQVPVPAERLAGLKLPDAVQPAVSLDLTADQRDWRIKLLSERRDLASDLYRLARRALKIDPAFAWQLVHETAYYDSDHEYARRILGFERLGDEWLSPFTASQRKKKLVWHDRFGWLPATHVERFDKGERYFRGRWYSAEAVTAKRAKFTNAWDVETDHYRVKTNVSREKGVELAVRLEEFHAWFQMTFPTFFTSPEQIQQTFEATRRNRKPFVVHFYRTQQEYVDRLKSKNPQIGITNGIYMPDERVAHFYNDVNADIISTLYHEATHQILFEMYSEPRRIAEHEHFWIIEGFACYMESLHKTDEGFHIADPSYVRFEAAHLRLTQDKYYVPLEQFAVLGKQTFQTHRQIRMNYSQASGLTHFFMHYKDGLYRDALLKHVAALYRPVGPGIRIAGMDVLTGIPAERLDEQYREYMRTLVPQPARPQNAP